MSSPWGLIANATIWYPQIVGTSLDPLTGNSNPVFGSELAVRAYIKKANINQDESAGIPVGSYRIEGYTVGILPTSAKLSTFESLRIQIDNLGSGAYYHQGKIHVVKTEVEEAGEGSQLQGYAIITGGL